MLYHNTKAMVCPLHDATDFDIVARVLQRDTLALYVHNLS